MDRGDVRCVQHPEVHQWGGRWGQLRAKWGRACPSPRARDPVQRSVLRVPAIPAPVLGRSSRPRCRQGVQEGAEFSPASDVLGAAGLSLSHVSCSCLKSRSSLPTTNTAAEES